MRVQRFIKYMHQVVCAVSRFLLDFAVEHPLGVMVVCVFLIGGLACIRNVNLVMRGEHERALSRDLAGYLVGHDYRFPASWVEFVNVTRKAKAGDSYVPCKRTPWLDTRYSIPWGHSLTDEVALTEVWFKRFGKDKKEVHPDHYLTSLVWENVLSSSENKSYIEKLYMTWMENQSKTNEILNKINGDNE